MAIFNNTGTYSSNGIETAPSVDYVINFTNIVSSIAIKAVDVTSNNISVKINDETNYHYIEAGDSISIEGVPISKITIKESGAKYIYHATHV